MTQREDARLKQSGPTNLTFETGFRMLNERLGSDWVIQSQLGQRGPGWTWRLRLIGATGKESQQVLSTSGTNLFELQEKAVRHVLSQLEIAPTPQEEALITRRMTRSDAALEWFSLALDDESKDAKAQAVERCRQALAADPDFAEARACLAGLLYNRGSDEEALGEARRALAQNPDGWLPGRMHLLMATILMRTHQVNEAEREIAAGLREEPDDPWPLVYGAELRRMTQDYDGAGAALRAALELDPRSAEIHARLAEVLLRQGQLTNALHHLTCAESLNAEAPKQVDMDTEWMLASAFKTAGDVAKALEHYHRFLKEAEENEIPEERLVGVRSTIRELESRGQPTPVSALPPRTYTAGELQAALKARLTEAEIVLAINPLATTPEMERWAREKLAETAGGLPRARRLFELMAERLHSAATGSRTAREVFEAWSDPNESFSCQEYAKLFIVLGRSVGLQTFYVHVDRDYAGTIVDHDCAVLFEGGKAWLVDPAYRWFGVAHQEFHILDDLQAIAHHAFQPHEQEARVELCRAGLKLDPEFAWGRWNLVAALIRAGQLEEARRELDAVRQQAPGHWRGYQLEGLLAFKHDQLEAAKTWWSKTVDMNPSEGNTRLLLGEVLFRMGEQAAARREFQAGLRQPYLTTENEELARARLKLLNEALGSDAGSIRSDPSPTEAGAYRDLGFSYLTGPTANYAEAVKWLRKAAELGDTAAQCCLGVLYWKGQGVRKDQAEAARWIHKAAQAGDPEGMRLQAMILLSGPTAEQRKAEAMQWLRRSAEAGDNLSRMLLGRSLYGGELAPKNVAEALFWLTLAAEAKADQTNRVSISLSPGGFSDSRKESIALLKEVRLFATPEELAEAQAKLELHKVEP